METPAVARREAKLLRSVRVTQLSPRQSCSSSLLYEDRKVTRALGGGAESMIFPSKQVMYTTHSIDWVCKNRCHPQHLSTCVNSLYQLSTRAHCSPYKPKKQTTTTVEAFLMRPSIQIDTFVSFNVVVAVVWMMITRTCRMTFGFFHS